ncbi:MAG: TlpA family protein disulfide reductase [Spirochaetaceae bacterium]|jgi:thiol-disulfide isomerase/thioredoxin|nr:TlpA family protein disulfide reductase [Spirochaetaceae bacterium]
MMMMMKQAVAWFILFSGAASFARAQSGGAVPQEIAAAFAKAGLTTLKKRAAPADFSLPLLAGDVRTSLGALKGKVVFLNFWATWCPPCREEMPSMEILHRRFKDAGLEFLAVDIREDAKQVDVFTKRFSLTFPVAMDATGSVSSRYGIRGIPATFIIDREGFVVLSVVGGVDWAAPAMIAAFEALLRYGR